MKNKLGYEGIVTKLHKKDKYNTQDMVKLRGTNGVEEWWPQHWLVQKGSERKWAEQGIANAMGKRLILERVDAELQQGDGTGVGAVKALRRCMAKKRPQFKKEAEIARVRKEKKLDTKLLSFL